MFSKPICANKARIGPPSDIDYCGSACTNACDLGSFVVLPLFDNFGESCLFRECREFEDLFGTNFTG